MCCNKSGVNTGFYHFRVSTCIYFYKLLLGTCDYLGVGIVVTNIMGHVLEGLVLYWLSTYNF